MSSTERRNLLDAIKAKYVSLEEPNYSFVERVAQDQPYASLVEALSRVAEIEETTDVHDDVSFRSSSVTEINAGRLTSRWSARMAYCYD